MFSQTLLYFFLSLLISGQYGVESSATGNQQHRGYSGSNSMIFNMRRTEGDQKLFVFGDSYVDTGNGNRSVELSWRYPYGITFPGVPVGRFSNGHLLTDFVAGFLGGRAPISYEQWMVSEEAKLLEHGMSFAYAGTGVLDTVVSYPNMGGQIDLLQQLINSSVYTSDDISNSSVALVVIAGNDYGSVVSASSSASEEVEEYVTEVVNLVAYNLKRINNLGVKKIAVGALEPIGCLPQHTYSYSFTQCNETLNAISKLHNILLQQAVDRFNNESTDSSRFVVLDLYHSFLSVIHSNRHPALHPDRSGSNKFENPLKPCCFGSSTGNSCGVVEDDGSKDYTLCDDPDSSFFWDIYHPTQKGWLTVFPSLQLSLQQLFSTSKQTGEVF